MATLRGLFLDLDGTLADSLPVMRLVYERFLAAHGRHGGDAEFARLNGPPLPDIVASLKAEHGLEETEETLLADYARLLDEAYDAVAPSAGALRLLEAGRARGWTAAVVTGHAAGRARQWLRRRGLDHLVAVVVGSDDSPRGKPHPDPYLTAIARCGCAAGESIAVEDTPGGAAAALAAGLPTYVIEGRAASEGPARCQADWPPVAGFLPGLDSLVEKL